MHYIIFNKLHLKRGGEKKLNIVRSVFDRAQITHEVLFTERIGHAKELTEKLTSNGEENTVIAMGGDGTLHEILNGFCDFDKNSLALIPYGTGNDFAAAAGIPKDVKRAAEIVAFHAPSYIDYIQLTGGLRSINAVGMGLDVDVLQRTYSGKSHGKSKYFRSLLASLMKFKSYEFTAEYEGVSEKRYGLIAALGNGKMVGGGIKLFPEASISDGYMDLIIVDYISRPKLIGALLKLVRGKVNTIKGATVRKVRSAKFTVSQDNYFIQAEGELYENVQIDAELISDKLKFYM